VEEHNSIDHFLLMKYALLFIVGALAAGWSHGTYLFSSPDEELEPEGSAQTSSSPEKEEPL
jgi:hypothetical protein